MTGIDCQKAEGMVNRYIGHTLSIEELEEFLDHIESCPSCYDELETYFIVHEAMQQLDEQEDGNMMDFKKMLHQDIRKSRRYIRQYQAIRFATAVLVLISLTALAAFFILGILGL